MRSRSIGLILIALLWTPGARADVISAATAGQAPTISAEYFGIHFHRLVLSPGERAVQTAWPPLQFGSVRLWDAVVRWGDIAPRAGQWDFERLDRYVNQAVQHRTSILYTLGSTPQWASARPNERCSYGSGCAAEPVRLAHWEEYVRRVARRYKGQIDGFELWNEPNFAEIPRDRGVHSFYSGSVTDMVAMARSARKVLDEENSRAILATPGFVNGPDRLDMFLAAGGKDHVQAIAYHFYSESAEHLAKQLMDVRAVMKKHGVANLPLWNTETGLEVYQPNERPPEGAGSGWSRSSAEAAAKMAQQLILGAAAGLARYYYYAWDNTRSGMVTASGESLPAYGAMAQVQKWLIGATFTGCESFRGGVVICRGTRGARRFNILWAETPVTHAVPLPSGFRLGGHETLWASPRDGQPRSTGDRVSVAVGRPPVLLWFEPIEAR